jgi:hypothetical protein
MPFDKLSGLPLPISIKTANDTNDVGATTTKSFNPLKSVNLTVVGSTGPAESSGASRRVVLPRPNPAAQEVTLGELLQQLDGLNRVPMVVLLVSAALRMVVDAANAFAKGVGESGKNPTTTNGQDLGGTADGIAQGARSIEEAIRNLIENSTYPNFSDFLKELVKISQQLREQATKAKLAAIEGNYNLMLEAASQMLVAAQEAKASRDKEIEAERSAAIGQIASGVITLAATGITYGITKDVSFSGAVSGAFGSISSGIATTVGTTQKEDASELQLYSDLANVAKQRLEAAAKLIEQQTQVADDIREIAKSLREFVLKLFEDMINNQNQAIQRANV